MNELPACRAEWPSDAPWWWLRASWLYAALTSGELPDHDGTGEKARFPVTLDAVGQVELDHGRLVVADPYLMDVQPAPVEQVLLSEPYDVLVATARVGPEHPRIAAAALISESDPVVAWDMAHWAGQDVSALGPEEFFGYGVDAGSGCFASLSAARVAGRVLAADGGMLEDPISRALSSGAPAAGAAVVATEDGAPTIAVFSSGWGDGMYPTWLGIDERGEVAVAMTDFMLTGDPYAAPEGSLATAPAPSKTPVPIWKGFFRKRG